MTRQYDGSDYDPPAPVLDVFLSPPGDPDRCVLALALADTGADISVLAVGLPARLGLPLVGKTEVAGVDDEPRSAPVWRVNVDMSGLGRFDVEAVELGGMTIVGRDILNRLSMRFDGPAELLRSAP
jgi:hypothetical protein